MLDGAVQEPIVFVDARNVVIRSRWPNLGEDWFLERTRAWAERESVRAQVVFDGRAPAWGDDGRMTVEGTGRAIADDRIAAEAERLADEAARLWSFLGPGPPCPRGALRRAHDRRREFAGGLG